VHGARRSLFFSAAAADDETLLISWLLCVRRRASYICSPSGFRTHFAAAFVTGRSVGAAADFFHSTTQACPLAAIAAAAAVVIVLVDILITCSCR